MQILKAKLAELQRQEREAELDAIRGEQRSVGFGSPDPLLRAAAVPDGQGPAHRARDRQRRRRARRRPRRVHGGLPPLAAGSQSLTGSTRNVGRRRPRSPIGSRWPVAVPPVVDVGGHQRHVVGPRPTAPPGSSSRPRSVRQLVLGTAGTDAKAGRVVGEGRAPTSAIRHPRPPRPPARGRDPSAGPCQPSSIAERPRRSGQRDSERGAHHARSVTPSDVELERGYRRGADAHCATGRAERIRPDEQVRAVPETDRTARLPSHHVRAAATAESPDR